MISICIPTRNRALLLRQALASIIIQANDEIEILICDNASTDGTREVVAEFQCQFPALIYNRWDQNVGFNRNLARSVELAQGRYCWFFGDDDVMMPGSLRRMLELCNEGLDVYLCGFISCDFQLEPLAEGLILSAGCDGVHDLAIERARSNYLRAALSLTALFGFMSTLVVSRAKWVAVSGEQSWCAEGWAHTSVIFGMIRDGLKTRYIHTPMLWKRGANDGLALESGQIERVRIYVDGYNLIAANCFGPASFEAMQFRRLLCKEIGINHLFGLKKEAVRSGDWPAQRVLDKVVQDLYQDHTLTNVLRKLAYRHTPFVVYELANRIYGPSKQFLQRFFAAKNQAARDGQ